MSQFREAGRATFLASNASIARYLRVINPLALAVAGQLDDELGVVDAAVFTTDTSADVILVNAPGTTPMVASGAITAGSRVFGDTGGMVTATPNANPIGLALQAATASNDVIEVLRKKYLPQFANMGAVGTTVTNTTAETALGSVTIPANKIKAGDKIKIKFKGTQTAVNSTDTQAVKLYIGGIGGTALLSLAATNGATGDIFWGEFELVCYTSGASGTCVGFGTSAVPHAAGSPTIKDTQLTSTALNTTIAQAITVSATCSAANAGDQITLDILDVDFPG